MNLTIGRPAVGNDFFDRKPELQRMWELIRNNNVLLIAPRRVGKTSLLFKLKEQVCNQTNFNAIYYSIARNGSEAGFIQGLLDTISKQPGTASILTRLLQSPVGELLRKIKSVAANGFEVEFKEESAQAWDKIGWELAGLLATDERQRWLMMIDELPLFVLEMIKSENGKQRVHRFLHWFRALRQGQGDRSDGVRWILAGSIGLDTVARKYGFFDAISDLTPCHLNAFDEKTAADCIRVLADSYSLELEPEVVTRILERVGWPIPFHIQLIMSRLIESRHEPTEPMTVARVNQEFEWLVGSSDAHCHFDYWRSRLFEELDRDEAEQAVVILDLCSRDSMGVKRSILSLGLAATIPDAETRDKKMEWLLSVLESDGYLVHLEKTWAFRSNILREYWRRRIACD